MRIQVVGGAGLSSRGNRVSDRSYHWSGLHVKGSLVQKRRDGLR
jgi:hypothetical protein